MTANIDLQNPINRTNTHFEDDYVIPTEETLLKENYVIISGHSGGGKSSILSELYQRGYLCIPEPGRQIVKEELSIGGDGLPWANSIKFIDLTLSRNIYNFNSTKGNSRWIFFDRSILDAVDAVNSVTGTTPLHFENAAKKFRYNKKVFITPPWREIYRNDSERKHSFAEASLSYETSIQTYSKYGYEVILIPKDNIKNRADFIIRHLELP